MAPKAAEREGHRHPISFRTTADLREKMEKAASVAGRSLTQEIEFRLEASFLRQVTDEVFLGGGVAADMLVAIAQVVRQTRSSARRRKWSEEETRDAISAAVAEVASVYLWNGQDELPAAPEGETHGEKAVPAAVGHEIALGHLIWSDDQSLEDATSYTVVNRWSGDGTLSKLVRSIPETGRLQARSRSRRSWARDAAQLHKGARS